MPLPLVDKNDPEDEAEAVEEAEEEGDDGMLPANPTGLVLLPPKGGLWYKGDWGIDEPEAER